MYQLQWIPEDFQNQILTKKYDNLSQVCYLEWIKHSQSCANYYWWSKHSLPGPSKTFILKINAYKINIQKLQCVYYK